VGLSIEAEDAIPYNAAILTRKGVLTSLNSDDAELMRHLDKEAAKTLKYGGLQKPEALSLIAINPAKQLKIDDKVGSLEVGLGCRCGEIFDEHPLELLRRWRRYLSTAKCTSIATTTSKKERRRNSPRPCWRNSSRIERQTPAGRPAQ
jgi:hypothetical protein